MTEADLAAAVPRARPPHPGGGLAVSVLICTRNRAASLRRTLGSLAGLIVPPGTMWEVVVIDNGSADDTPAVVEAFTQTLPIRRVFAPDPGLSNARNRGLAVAAGRYIVWTDDDVEVEPRWLAAYLSLFGQFPTCAIFGGKSVPVLEAPVTAWFAQSRDHLCDLLAIRDFGSRPVALSVSGNRLPYGLNFAVRADVQRQFPYDPDLGVAPGRRRSGEEIDVIARILAAGHEGRWSPDPVVRHLIPAERQTRDYVASYYRSAGEQRAEYEHRFRRQAMLCGVPLRVWAKYVVLHFGCAIARALPGVNWVPLFARQAFYVGAVARWRRGF